MSVWLSFPSKRPPAEAQACIDKWRAKGYKVAVWRDAGDTPVSCDLMLVGYYKGYARAQNELTRQIFAPAMRGEWLECHGTGDRTAQWVVCAGDDTDPDPNHTPEEIACECSAHFADWWSLRMGLPYGDGSPEPVAERLFGGILQGRGSSGEIIGSSKFIDKTKSFGVMQPTGDRFAGGSIDRIAGSPWIGREFALRVNGGQGPYWPEYTHMFVDEEIMEVALNLGVFWQRPDLIHLHHHFMRQSVALDSPAVPKPIPSHLAEANSPQHWDKYQRLFRQRKAAGFPGHEPLVAVCA